MPHMLRNLRLTFCRRWSRVSLRICFVGLLLVGTYFMRKQFNALILLKSRSRLIRADETTSENSTITNTSISNIVLRPAHVEAYVSCGTEFADYRGLGNQMFNFAAVVHVARLTNRRPALIRYPCRYFGTGPLPHCPHKMPLEEVFILDVDMFDDLCPCQNFYYSPSATFDNNLEKMALPDDPSLRNKSIVVMGFRQGWKYVRLVEKELRRHFTILPEVQNCTEYYLEQMVPLAWKRQYFARVGIHVRRNDVLWPRAVAHGHATPNLTFFLNAMDYFIQRNDRVQFIICSDDMLWCKEHITQDLFNSSLVNVTYFVGKSQIADFAMLANTNHVIISSGSFGWWAAWLTRGIAVFYKHWPTKNTTLYGQFTYNDYWPPHWIPIE